jgi:D-tyrosyl-tRNA(Tyr) deacylase
MRVVVQRVKEARVEVEGKVVGEIGYGLLVYAGLEKGDGEREIEFMAEKILNLRVFADIEGKMNLSIQDVGPGEILSISQFTLASHIKKGRRPDFNNAMEPEKANQLYERFNRRLATEVKVATGVFGAMMDINSINLGPVTFIIEKQFM